jgi:hypothetical protein
MDPAGERGARADVALPELVAVVGPIHARSL